jgi:hypothetical protein
VNLSLISGLFPAQPGFTRFANEVYQAIRL